MLAITIFTLLVLLFSVVIHELAHGYVAYSLGDHTAKYEGRLTLNPIKHLDPFGSVLLPLLLLLASGGQGPIIGWAKPVPVNPYNFRDQKWGSFKVAIAGPLTNFGIALVLGVLIRVLHAYPALSGFTDMLGIVVFYNILWGLFNLVPIPPLDGSWLLFHFFPSSMEALKMQIHQYGIFLLIFFIFFGGLGYLGAAAQVLYLLVTGSVLTL